jgi:glycosyltransferase involved in cell wall biosynthesis
MKISVLTVCYNAAETIRQTLDSFCAQTYRDKELLVIDGASTDTTLEIARSYAGADIQVSSAPDRGMYDALNKGLMLYSGDAFGVLNADDTYHHEGVLSEIAEALKNVPIVQGNLNYVSDHASKHITRRWRGELKPELGFKTGWMPAHPTFYVRREVANQVGEFDLSLETAADYDWMLRAVDVFGFEVGLLDQVLIDMKTGGRSTKDILSHVRHNLEALSVRQRWLEAGLIDYALFAKPARKIGQLFAPARKIANGKNNV